MHLVGLYTYHFLALLFYTVYKWTPLNVHTEGTHFKRQNSDNQVLLVPLPSQYECKDYGCLTIASKCMILWFSKNYNVTKRIRTERQSCSVISNIHPSKLSHNHFHKKFSLMSNSFEHSYFGALKIIYVMLILNCRYKPSWKHLLHVCMRHEMAAYL